MFKLLKKLFRSTTALQPIPDEQSPINSRFSSDDMEWYQKTSPAQRAHLRGKRAIQRNVFQDVVAVGHAMDSWDEQNIKRQFFNGKGILPEIQMDWYAGQGFIGAQLCAILAQNWIIYKSCNMPAKDAARHGFELTANSGDKISADFFQKMRDADQEYGLHNQLVQFLTKGRIFGIRIAMFKIDGTPEYLKDFYENPYNPDGIKKDSYRGIVQVDPYWITPELDIEDASDPSSVNFYNPTWWRINGRRYHRSHLIIYRNGDLPDILKPSYIYGGLPLPQLMAERVYAAEKTANEAPMLVMTKRLSVLTTDTELALANQEKFDNRMEMNNAFRDNYGTRVIGDGEEWNQFDTTLTDVDDVTMTQYHIIAAIAEVPVTKLLGTSPKGMNATGEYDEASYHEFLESLQQDVFTPLVKRHHEIWMRSEGIKDKKITIKWLPVDSQTAKELAETNKMKAETDLIIVQTGAIKPQEVRQRITTDPNSGYNGLPAEDPEVEEDYEDQPDDDASSEEA